MQGYPYHDKLPFCHWSLETLDPTPHLPLVATCSIAWSVCPSVLYINPNTSPKELQLSSLGYFSSLRDEPLVILTRPVVTCTSCCSFHLYHFCLSSGPIASGFTSWLQHTQSRLTISTLLHQRKRTWRGTWLMHCNQWHSITCESKPLICKYTFGHQLTSHVLDMHAMWDASWTLITWDWQEGKQHGQARNTEAIESFRTQFLMNSKRLTYHNLNTALLIGLILSYSFLCHYS